MSKKKENSFEESLNRLQEISNSLESGDIGLEESIKLYEEGINLAKLCYTTLKDAELKVTELKKQLEQSIKQ
ncbi:MAG: exodeoxyribonuclease VII small subunit [Ignavibacteriales bacterium]|jgi:exodeoxyribonuclease VII small subunit|nr:exodeoxyribonuclease VII small subunit [Ignavibacteriales bacterium]MCX6173262.1 exodeoxyribonuclease VII small subunit [Ignavibacteriales bacterium]TSA29250.1 MAG: exodeoxyribonuclease VII small subunit [Ignavibacteriales bacterium]